MSCDKCLAVRFPVPEVSQGFLHSKTSQSHFWEEIRLFRTLSLINYWTTVFFIERNFEDDFSAKIEVNEWIKTNMAGASYHPRIVIPKYEQTGNVKPLTANSGLPFAVRWPNLDLKVQVSNDCSVSINLVPEALSNLTGRGDSGHVKVSSNTARRPNLRFINCLVSYTWVSLPFPSRNLSGFFWAMRSLFFPRSLFADFLLFSGCFIWHK